MVTRISNGVPLSLRVFDLCFDELWSQSVHHIEEVSAVRQPSLRQRIWEVQHDLLVLQDHREQVLDGQLVELWNGHAAQLTERQQLFLVRQYLL